MGRRGGGARRSQCALQLLTRGVRPSPCASSPSMPIERSWENAPSTKRLASLGSISSSPISKLGMPFAAAREPYTVDETWWSSEGCMGRSAARQRQSG